MIKTVEWTGRAVRLIDQRKLPAEEVYVEFATADQVAGAIKQMVTRGAPAIGVTAAMGAVLSAINIKAEDHDTFFEQYEKDLQTLAEARPTAVNLSWAVNRMRDCAIRNKSLCLDEIRRKLEDEALAVYNEDLVINRTMGENGAELVEPGETILTHCNAGALATAGGYGTIQLSNKRIE